jgi:hypothetical protein
MFTIGGQLMTTIDLRNINIGGTKINIYGTKDTIIEQVEPKVELKSLNTKLVKDKFKKKLIEVTSKLETDEINPNSAAGGGMKFAFVTQCATKPDAAGLLVPFDHIVSESDYKKSLIDEPLTIKYSDKSIFNKTKEEIRERTNKRVLNRWYQSCIQLDIMENLAPDCERYYKLSRSTITYLNYIHNIHRSIEIPDFVLCKSHIEKTFIRTNKPCVVSDFRDNSNPPLYNAVFDQIDRYVAMGYIKKEPHKIFHNKQIYRYSPIMMRHIGPYDYNTLEHYFRYLTTKINFIVDFPFVTYKDQTKYAKRLDFSRKFYLEPDDPCLVTRTEKMKKQAEYEARHPYLKKKKSPGIVYFDE